MAVSGKPIKFFLTNADGEEVELSEPVRMSMPAFEVSFSIGADTDFAKAMRRWLRRRWTIAWLEQFAAWAFGKN